MPAFRVKSRGSRDAAAERRIARAEVLGILMRTAPDMRQPFDLKSEGAFELHWHADPCQGRLTQWRVVNVRTGQRVMRGAPKTIGKAFVAACLPVVAGNH